MNMSISKSGVILFKGNVFVTTIIFGHILSCFLLIISLTLFLIRFNFLQTCMHKYLPKFFIFLDQYNKVKYLKIKHKYRYYLQKL